MTDIASLRPPTLDEVRAAAKRIAPHVVRTPLIRLNLPFEDRTIWLKLENLQPIGAFKSRPAFHSIACLPEEARAKGVYTISTGNMALGVASAARELGVPMDAYVYEGAPDMKVKAVEAAGGRVVALPKEQWWRTMFLEEQPETDKSLVHPILQNSVFAANGTIALEVFEDLPEVDAVYIPYGGGGGTTGIGSTLKNLKPEARVVPVEGAHATPLTAAFAAGHPVTVDFQSCFVESIGATTVFPVIFGFLQSIVDHVAVAPLDDVAEALRILFARNKVVAEGAGAASVAAAIADPKGKGNLVCIVSGGNIDSDEFCRILNHEKGAGI